MKRNLRPSYANSFSRRPLLPIKPSATKHGPNNLPLPWCHPPLVTHPMLGNSSCCICADHAAEAEPRDTWRGGIGRRRDRVVLSGTTGAATPAGQTGLSLHRLSFGNGDSAHDCDGLLPQRRDTSWEEAPRGHTRTSAHRWEGLPCSSQDYTADPWSVVPAVAVCPFARSIGWERIFVRGKRHCSRASRSILQQSRIPFPYMVLRFNNGSDPHLSSWHDQNCVPRQIGGWAASSTCMGYSLQRSHGPWSITHSVLQMEVASVCRKESDVLCRYSSILSYPRRTPPHTIPLDQWIIWYYYTSVYGWKVDNF
jgi:hypothetical protein